MAARGSGLARPVQPDDVLADVIGSSRPISRAEITKKIWVYIKKNRLQDPNNKRKIIADDVLGPLFGGRRSVDMLDLARLVSAHIEK